MLTCAQEAAPLGERLHVDERQHDDGRLRCHQRRALPDARGDAGRGAGYHEGGWPEGEGARRSDPRAGDLLCVIAFRARVCVCVCVWQGPLFDENEHHYFAYSAIFIDASSANVHRHATERVLRRHNMLAQPPPGHHPPPAAQTTTHHVHRSEYRLFVCVRTSRATSVMSLMTRRPAASLGPNI